MIRISVLHLQLQEAGGGNAAMGKGSVEELGEIENSLLLYCG